MELIKSNDNLMDMNEAAALLHIRKSTLYGMVMRRQITYVKIGKLNRFRRQDLDRWIEEHTRAGNNAGLQKF